VEGGEESEAVAPQVVERLEAGFEDAMVVVALNRPGGCLRPMS